MLKRIEVKNFKPLKHIDFQCAGLNLLMGLNGAGKSSFVQLMMFLKSIARMPSELAIDVPLKECGEDIGTFDDLRYCHADRQEPISFTVDFEAPELSKSLIVNYGSGAVEGSITRNVCPTENNPKVVRIENPIKSLSDAEYEAFLTKWRKPYELPDGSIDTAAHWNEIFKNPDYKKEAELIRADGNKHNEQAASRDAAVAEAYKDTWRNVKFVSSFRERPHAIYAGSISDESRIFMYGRVRVSPDGSDIAEFLHKFGDYIEVNEYYGRFPGPMIHPTSVATKSDGPTPNKLSDQLKFWLNEVSPGAQLHIEKVTVSDDEKYVLSVGFGDDSPKKFKPQNVGFGISYVLPVIVSLLMANEDEVVIIENPEAHLHPKGQAAMGNLIARAVASGVQVFVETHSDHVVNGIRSAVKDGIVKPSDVNIAFFERKEHDVPNEDGSSHQEIYSEVRNIRVDKNGSLSEYPDGFLDEWNNQLMELI